MPEVTIPRAPAHLGTHGRALWRAVLADFELRPDELPVLESACRQRDDLARLEAALGAVGTLTAGSKDQERPHPLFVEARLARLALARMLAQLGLGEVARMGAEKSHAGRRLARLRWSA